MLRRKKNNIKEKINNYIKFIEKKVIDNDLKEEIINQIHEFTKYGEIFIQGVTLYGKIIKTEGNDYIEIKCAGRFFTCNYTKWNSSAAISINQTGLKNGNVKVSCEEKVDYICPKNKNSTDSKKIEKVYNDKGFIICDSTINEKESYDSYGEQLLYEETSIFNNSYNVEKNWYFTSGTIINYKLQKQNYDLKNIEESYSICEKPFDDDFATNYIFAELDKELFVQFMTGLIDLETLILQNKLTQKSKKLITKGIKLK